MKIKMHYLDPKNNIVCGQKAGLSTTINSEITCKRCLKTKKHRKSKGTLA